MIENGADDNWCSDSTAYIIHNFIHNNGLQPPKSVNT